MKKQLYRSHRYPGAASVEVHLPKSRVLGRVMDVHQDGAKLAGVQGVQRGDKITLSIGYEKVSAVVRWAAPDRCGVSFSPQLSSRSLSTLRTRTGTGHTGRWTTQGLTLMR